MRKETARYFWRRYLRLVCDGSASLQVDNPANHFVVGVKAGEYDEFPDEEYNELMEDYEQFYGIWKRKRQCAAGDVLLNALQMTKLNRRCCDGIADLLAECSAGSDYSSESEKEDRDALLRELSNACDWPEEEEEESEDHSPRAVYEYLCQRIHGQEAAKRAAAMILYNHMEGRRSTAVFCGPSGCGKSEIWRCLSKRYPKLIRFLDASRMSADGWKGSVHLRDAFDGVSETEIRKQGLIVVLDEADKACCETVMGNGGTNYSTLLQNSLLKMMDGDEITFGKEDGKPAISVDCSRVSVVLLGAFENLLRNKNDQTGGIGFGASARIEHDYSNTDISYDDLIMAGMRREVAGRINRIVSLRPLSVSDYRAILTGPVLDDLQAGGKYRVVIDDDSADRLSQQAAATGLGVRWMRSQVMNAMDDLMFSDPAAELYTVRISADPAGVSHGAAA